jgi:hypothetical protein
MIAGRRTAMTDYSCEPAMTDKTVNDASLVLSCPGLRKAIGISALSGRRWQVVAREHRASPALGTYAVRLSGTMNQELRLTYLCSIIRAISCALSRDQQSAGNGQETC